LEQIAVACVFGRQAPPPTTKGDHPMHKLTAAVIAALTVGGPTIVSSASVTRPDTLWHGGAFTIYAPTKQMAFLPVRSGELSLGDRAVFSDDDLSSKHGKSLGMDGGVCTVVRITDAASHSGVLQCDITFSLPDGQIATQGLIRMTNGNLTGTQPAAITGGTGKYRDATGEIATNFLSFTEAYVTFFLNG
jgi:hypothetical protein